MIKLIDTFFFLGGNKPDFDVYNTLQKSWNRGSSLKVFLIEYHGQRQELWFCLNWCECGLVRQKAPTFSRTERNQSQNQNYLSESIISISPPQNDISDPREGTMFLDVVDGSLWMVQSLSCIHKCK